MGGLSTRSGFVAAQEPTERLRHEVLPALRRARFGIIDEEEAAAERPYAVLLDVSELDDVATAVQLARARHPGAPVIAICAPGPGAEFRLLSAFRNGVLDSVLLDAANVDDLVETVKLTLERHRLDCESKRLTHSFSAELGRRARGLLKANDALEAAYESTLHALVAALDVREKATACHSMRVSYYTCFLAILMDCPEDDLQDFYRGALLHDIGKIGIPDAILLKPAKLDEEEFETMKRHTTLGRDFLCGIDYLSRAIDIPYCHHEKWNGTGYPQGLEGERIPFGARLFAVADVYDALRSRRCYKDPMSHETALGIIVGDSGTHFDPAIVAAFERVPEATWSALDVAARREVNDFRSMVAFCRDAVAALDEAEVMEPVS